MTGSALRNEPHPSRRAEPLRSSGVDVLRALAVTMVMLAHLPFSLSGVQDVVGGEVFPGRFISEALAHGHYGVQLFLVISGFCIHMRWARHGDPTARIDFLAFWRRRLTRLYPPYVAVLALSLTLTIAARHFYPGSVPFLSNHQLLVDVVVLLLLVQNLTDASARVGNPPFWSLALEEQLYLLYFPLLSMRVRFGWRATLVVSLGATIGWLLAGAHVPATWALGWYRAGPAYWFAWALGAFAAELYLDAHGFPRWATSTLLFAVAGCTAVAVEPPFRDLAVTLMFFFVLTNALARERSLWPGPRWLGPVVALGKISYGVYLVHNIAFVVSKRVLVTLGAPPLSILPLRALAGVAAGYVVYRIFEVPFLRMSQKVRIPIVSQREPPTG